MSSVGRRRRDQLWSTWSVAAVVIAFQTLIPSAVAARTTRINSRDVCQRDPPDIRADSLPGDRGFRIQILGHSLRYAPRQVYTVAINGSYPNQRLSGFMLVAVPLHARDETTAMGTFQHIDTSSTRSVPNCPHVITDVTRHPKSFVEVLWTAPPSGAGCVEFRATVIERGETWFRDDGALTRVFCEDTRTTESERSPEMIPDCCACGTAKYQLTFHGKWSHASHPKDYPTQRRLLHWSNIVGATHSRNYMVWQYGAYASRGVKEVCELGYPRTVEEEIQQRSREVRTIIKTTGIWWSEPHGIDQTRTARFSTDRRRHLMSMLTMIGPSPDWCVGVSAIDMCLPNCTWAGDMNIDLYPWDAGTDDGITYMSPNARSDPQQKIHRITNQFPDNPESPFHGRLPIRPLAQLQIRRINVPSTSPSPTDARPEQAGSGVDALQCTDNNDVEDVLELTDAGAAGLTDMEKQKLMMMQQQDGGKCSMSPWDDWSSCSVTCGVGLRVRKRVYINPMVDESMCGLPLMESENCIGLENECETVDEDCAMTAWSSWSPCSASCEKGIRQRRRYYLNKEDMARCSRESDETEMCIAEIMDCEKARAMAQSTAVCSLPVSLGPCRGNFPRWYYDNEAGQCVQFSYGGCRGNGNRFESLEECLQVCSATGDRQVAVLGTPATTTTTTTVQPSSLRQNSCPLPKDPGPCRANFHSWYFDTDMGKCLPFIYGGCRGNGNRFATEDECTDVCVLLLEPSSQRPPSAPDRQTSTVTTTNPTSPRNQPLITRPPTTSASQRTAPTRNGSGVAKNADRSTASPPVHCSVGVWSSWSSCSVTCGSAANQTWRTRQRQVRRESANGGRACPSQLEQKKKCENISPCPTVSTVHCPMSPWSEWSPCSKTCGSDAVQERESHVMPAGTGNSTTVQCSGPIRLLRRICSDLPPCSRSQSASETTFVRRSRSRSLV